MNTFTGYIEYGKGRGLIYFLIVSIVLSIIFGVSMNNRLQNAAKDEAVVNFINRMPSFTIENGQVVSPQNAYIVVPFETGGQDGFILDTTNTPMDQLTFANGIYVTTNKAYFKTGETIQETPLGTLGNKVITHEVLQALLLRLVTMAAFFYALFLFGALWVGYGILYVLVKLFFLILGRTTCPYIRGRSVFVAWSSILILDFVLFAFGYGFSPANALAFALILAIFIVFRTPLHSMDVEESLNALGQASSTDNMDFLDRELAKNPSGRHASFAAEKTLAQIADDNNAKTAFKPSVKSRAKATASVSGKKTVKAAVRTSGKKMVNATAKTAQEPVVKKADKVKAPKTPAKPTSAKSGSKKTSKKTAGAK